jgi:Spy/CpxP family protein refolding chaperone
MRIRILSVFTLFLLMTALARGQKPDADPIGQNLFAPDLVMQHQDALGLTEDQKTYFKTEIHQSQMKFMDWQWKLQEEMEKLVALIRQPHVEEKDTLAELEKLLAIEREVKREQVTLLVRIKNKLTPEQQTRLAKLRNGS